VQEPTTEPLHYHSSTGTSVRPIKGALPVHQPAKSEACNDDDDDDEDDVKTMLAACTKLRVGKRGNAYNWATRPHHVSGMALLSFTTMCDCASPSSQLPLAAAPFDYSSQALLSTTADRRREQNRKRWASRACRRAAVRTHRVAIVTGNVI
jgi:hypothetical protein